VKRILSILMICLFMVAMMAVTASVAFADPDCRGAAAERVSPCKPDGKFSGPK
jgi:hypothetical protein